MYRPDASEDVIINAVINCLNEANIPVNDITVAQEIKFIKDNY